jgi:methyl-accepting chemotaxis protein
MVVEEVVEETSNNVPKKRGRPPGSSNADRAAKKGLTEVANFVWDSENKRLASLLKIRMEDLGSKFTNCRDSKSTQRAWNIVHEKFKMEFPAAINITTKTLSDKFNQTKRRYQELKAITEGTGNQELSLEDEAFYDITSPFFADRPGLSSVNLGEAESIATDFSESESTPSKPLKSPTFGSSSSSKFTSMSVAIQGLGADLKDGLKYLGGNEGSQEIKETMESIKETSNENRAILKDISSGINDLNKSIGDLVQVLVNRNQ